MKLLLTYLIVCLSLNLVAQTPEKTHVITHDHLTIVTNPSKGENPYPAWGVFPSKETPVRKILMHLTLGTPDSISTAHWDYKDHITVKRAGGENGKSLDLEIGRMLTPYGSIYSTGWEFKWTVDVTDFTMILRDSVEIEYNHTGYEPTSVGWALTIDFEFTMGPPHIHPLQINNMWVGSYNYGNPEKPTEAELTPIKYNPLEESVINRLRIQHTGHGMDKPKGCSEFCSRWRRVLFNGEVVQDKDLWKECGDNPLYPQGGTWIFDRALWCPGDLQAPDIIDVYPASGENEFEILMEPYIATENIQAKEAIASCLIQYGAPVSKYDVEMVEIVTPNNRPLYNRSNPKCFDSKIIIRNLGSKNLTSLTISYGTKGFDQKVFKWKGNLSYYGSEEVILPGSHNFDAGLNTFVVELKKPNGRKDAWVGDNSMTTQFDAPVTLPENIIVQYRTNNQPEENHVFIVGESGDTLYQKTSDQVEKAHLYVDTLNLTEGLYEMFLIDTAGQGLEFWFMRDQGFGYIRILDMDGNLLHLFTADCGEGEMLAFQTDPEFVNDPAVVLYDFALYPKVVTEEFALEVYSRREIELEVVLKHEGKVVEKHFYPKTKGGTFKYNIAHLPDNRYIAEVYINGELKHKSRCQKASNWQY
ncbi:MAG: peptide-N-glycosidase F-related protein [Bacteroidota bacterium]|nr:peptide-N-glycosidase F-related protein [Bacteroidota bacterium]